MKELLRCKPCGYIIESDKLGDVCPACGMPRTAFETYRERVDSNRLFILKLDLHPIAIHLSQTFVIIIPAFIIFKWIFPDILPEIISNVLLFTVYVFPLSLVAAILTGVLDGLYRFKSLKPPLLKLKILYSVSILTSSILTFIFSYKGEYSVFSLIFSLISLVFAVRLGLLGKHLIDVILPGGYSILGKKKKKATPSGPQSFNI